MGPYSLDLRAADGHAIHLGAATATRGHRVGPHFMGAGAWTVEMNTELEWEFVLAPVVGSRRFGGCPTTLSQAWWKSR